MKGKGMRLESRSAAVGIQPWQTLSCPCPRELWQSVASGTAPAKPWCCNCCSASLCSGRTRLGRKMGIQQPCHSQFPCLEKPGSGGIDCDKWQVGQDDCDHCTPGLQLLGTAIPNKTSGFLEAKSQTFGPLVPLRALLASLWSPVWK